MSMKSRGFLAFGLCGLLAACVGDNPEPSEGSDGPSSSSSGQTGSSGAPTGSSGAPSSSSGGGGSSGTSSSSGGQTGALTVTVPAIAVTRNATTSVAVTLAGADVAGNIRLEIDDLPTGVSAPEVSVPGTATTATLEVSATTAAAFTRGQTIHVTATADNSAATAEATLSIRGARGELDTSYGANGVAVLDAQHSVVGGTARSALFVGGTLYVLGRTNGRVGGNRATLTAVSSVGQADTTHLGGVATTGWDYPANYTDAAVFARDAQLVTKNGVLAAGAFFQTSGSLSTATQARATYTLAIDTGVGSYVAGSPVAYDKEFHMALVPGVWGATAAAPVLYDVGVGPFGGTFNTNLAGKAFLRSVSASGGIGGQFVSARAFDPPVGDTFVTLEGQFVSANAADAFLAVSATVAHDGKAYPAVYTQHVNDDLPTVSRLADQVTGEPLVTAISSADSQQRLHLGMQAGGSVCVYRIPYTGAPAKLGCRLNPYLAGIYAMSGDRIAVLDHNGATLKLHVLAGGEVSPEASAPGWTDGGAELAGAALAKPAGLVEDDAGGVLVVDASAAPWKVRRYFFY